MRGVMKVSTTLAMLALAGGCVAWFSRPGVAESEHASRGNSTARAAGEPVRSLPSVADSQTVPAAMPRRNAADFAGPESDGPSMPRLSAAVSEQDGNAIAAAWRSGDFATAARLSTVLRELDDRRLILRPLVEAWVQADPEAAAQFARALPAGVERREILETAVRAWAALDVASASRWLDALPPDPDHDPAIAAVALCEVLYQRRPEIALSWAESVSEPRLRWEAICTVASDWARRDAPAAERYLANSPVLTVAERAQAVAHVRRWAAVVR